MGLTNRETHGIINTENKKEVNTMKTFEYAVIDPITLINIVERAFRGAMAIYNDIDEDYYELSVYDCTDLEMLEDVLAEYV